jgi:hypothetical protein
MTLPTQVTCYDYGHGNMDVCIGPMPAPKRAPEPPIIAALRLAQLRDDLAHRSALQRLRVTAQAEYQSAAIHEAVMQEKAEMLAVLERYR